MLTTNTVNNNITDSVIAMSGVSNKGRFSARRRGKTRVFTQFVVNDELFLQAK